MIEAALTRVDPFDSIIKKTIQAEGINPADAGALRSMVNKLATEESIHRTALERHPDLVDQEAILNAPDVMKVKKEIAELEGGVKLNTPERAKFRDQAFMAMMAAASPKQNRQAYIVIGPPGAGKSTAITRPILERTGARSIDFDDARSFFPENNGGRHSLLVEEEALLVARRAFESSINSGDDIVIQQVGDSISAMDELVNSLDAKGYDIHILFSDVELTEAARRAVGRFREEGRFVDPSYILSIGDRINETYSVFKNDPRIRSYEQYDNNGRKAVRKEKGTNRRV